MKRLMSCLCPTLLGMLALAAPVQATPIEDLQKVLDAGGGGLKLHSDTYDEGNGETKQFDFFKLRRAGALVLCENALVNNGCTGSGISDILLFAKKGDKFITLYSDPIAKDTLDKLATLIQNKDQVTYMQEGFLLDMRKTPSKLGGNPINLTTGINQNGVVIPAIQNTTICIQDFPFAGGFSREFIIASDTTEKENIPEPATLLLLAGGLCPLLAVRRHYRRTARRDGVASA